MEQYKESFIQSLLKQGFTEEQAIIMWSDYDKEATVDYNQSLSDAAFSI